MLRLILVRHGQTDANQKHLLQGQSDGLLNATGRQQAEELAQQLKDFPIDQIISSNLRRAQDTATAVAQYHQLDVKTTPLIREWNVGVLDGLPAEEFRKILAEPNISLSKLQPEGGETLLDVRQRALAFLNDLVANYEDQTVLVCTHGDFMRILLSLVQQVDVEKTSGIYFDNASYSVMELENGYWNVVALNQTSGKRNK